MSLDKQSAPHNPPVADPVHILSVNLDWGFIILNAGKDRGIAVGQEAMFTGKDSRMISVRITKVEPTLAIAAIPDPRIRQAEEGLPVTIR